ncbi:carbohydrate ABC transporter permease [Paenibacillus eucommiae]|uniref:Multiple sugar transport system permease protein n=1 Tax=Paenibacillus eucommiae TaxID=1355755 RepID=A0ABS4J1P9_9BACL|nr:sugar ABC transporter permease [Paenibacillus eucommiae]MBP1993250.1 multiple sugar transport system permease protein [Paenibacillus eucommiae]
MQKSEITAPVIIRQPKRNKWISEDAKWAFLLLIPLFVGIGLIYFSTIFGFVMSFTSWDIVRKAEWVGLDNYRTLASDELVWKAMRNTLVFLLISTPAKLIIGLALAILLNQKLKGISFFRLTYFFPTACSVVAIALVWGYLYGTDGFLNTLLQDIGLSKVYWMDENHAMGSIAIMSVWGGMGYIALLFLAGLQNVPTEYYEASYVDGASKLRQFWNITLPLLTPTTFFIVVTQLIAAFQMFGEVYLLSGPLDSTLTIVQYIFNEAFQGFRMGYASALSYVLILIIFLITIVQLKLQKKWVHYDL